MLTFYPVNESSRYYDEVMALYVRAFPENERRPLEPLLRDDTGESEAFAVLEGEKFAGMALLLTYRDITHILYFAVEEELRGRGIGSEILRLIRERHPGNRVVADLEEPEDGAPNAEQRRKRMDFYIRNGYSATSVRYRWVGEDYVILSLGGDVGREEFGRFWEHFYREREGFDY